MQEFESCVTEAIILVKAAPQASRKHRETVCIAALDLYQNWLRLYPVSFRYLADQQKFGRWDKIQFRCWKPKPFKDARVESRRVDQKSIEITGQLRPAERASFLSRSIVHSLKKEREAGRSLALLRPEVLGFHFEKLGSSDLSERRARFKELRDQLDLFGQAHLVPYEPCPYIFKYRYRDEDGEHIGTCQDWEMEATFFKWRRLYEEQAALAEMARCFGDEYPRKGMTLAMGTHSQYPDTWLVNGVIRLDEVTQPTLF